MPPRPQDSDDLKAMRAELVDARNRHDLVAECMKSHQDSVMSLITQNADWSLVEEHRDKATFYYESLLDITIVIGRLSRKLDALKK